MRRTEPLEYDPVVHGYSAAVVFKYDITSIEDVVKIFGKNLLADKIITSRIIRGSIVELTVSGNKEFVVSIVASKKELLEES